MRKRLKLNKGQALAEYSVIVLFVGVAACSAYAELGLGIKAFAGNVAIFITTGVAAL